MRTVKSEKEKERIRERVKEIGGKAWEDGYKEIADALDELDRVTKGSLDATAKIEDTFATIGDSVVIAGRADSCSRIEKIVVDDTVSYKLRPAYEEIEDIYHQWFPEDGDAPFTKEVFKELPKRIIASALETVIASEIIEMLLSLTSVKRRDHDTAFLSHFKKRITDLLKRFSLSSANISALTLGELERNFSLPRNDSYYSLLNYLFGPEPNVPSIKEFVVAKHPTWFPCSLDEPWRIFIHATGMIETMTTREIVERLATGTLSEEDAFKTLPGSVRNFIKEEADKRKLELEADEYKSKLLYGDWGFPPITREEASAAEMLIAKEERGVPEPETELKAERISVTRGGSSVPYSPILPEGYYSVVGPATGIRTDMTEEELKELFKESREAFIKSRTSRCEDED